MILYPTLNSEAIDQIVQFRGPVHGEEMARVVLRPVNLFELEQLLRGGGEHQIARRRVKLAHRLVFGDHGR